MSEKVSPLLVEARLQFSDLFKVGSQEYKQLISSYRQEVKQLGGLGDDELTDFYEVLARIAGDEKDHYNHQVEKPAIDFDTSLRILYEAIMDEPDSPYANNTIYHQEEVIKTLFKAFKRVSAVDGVTSLKEASYKLTAFLEKYAQYRAKHGFPRHRQFETEKRQILDKIDDASSLHEILFEKILEKIYFPLSEASARLDDDEIYKLNNLAIQRRREHPWIYRSGKHPEPNLHFERKKLPLDQGAHFQAHGVDNTMSHGYNPHLIDLKNLLFLLESGVDENRGPFYTLELRRSDEDESAAAVASGASHPYTEGGFIVVTDYDKQDFEGGIHTVLVNPHFYDAIPLLSERFPEVTFIRADKLVEEFSKLVPAAVDKEKAH